MRISSFGSRSPRRQQPGSATRQDKAPVAIYGVVLLGSAIAYSILTFALVSSAGSDARIARALGRDRKGKFSVVAYAVGIAVAPVVPWISLGVYIAVSLVWLVPDRRMERVIDA